MIFNYHLKLVHICSFLSTVTNMNITFFLTTKKNSVSRRLVIYVCYLDHSLFFRPVFGLMVVMLYTSYQVENSLHKSPCIWWQYLWAIKWAAVFGNLIFFCEWPLILTDNRTSTQYFLGTLFNYQANINTCLMKLNVCA